MGDQLVTQYGPGGLIKTIPLYFAFTRSDATRSKDQGEAAIGVGTSFWTGPTSRETRRT